MHTGNIPTENINKNKNKTSYDLSLFSGNLDLLRFLGFFEIFDRIKKYIVINWRYNIKSLNSVCKVPINPGEGITFGKLKYYFRKIFKLFKIFKNILNIIDLEKIFWKKQLTKWTKIANNQIKKRFASHG